MAIRIKDGSSAKWEMFGAIHPKLGLVFFDLCHWLEKYDIEEIIITSMIRPQLDDSGVHALGRAMDVSVSTIPTNLRLVLAEYINKKYVYDPMRTNIQTFVLHTGSGYNNDQGEHIHLQVL